MLPKGMRSVVVAVVLLMVSAPLSGCFGDEPEAPDEVDGFDFADSVSYTHLTLPTICSV